MGVRVRVGFKDSTGVQSGQNFPLGGFGAHGASGAFGAHGLLRAAPLATNCWPEAPRAGRGVGVLGPAESPSPRVLLVLFPSLRSPVVGVLGLWWMWHGVRVRVSGAQQLAYRGCAGCCGSC